MTFGSGLVYEVPDVLTSDKAKEYASAFNQSGAGGIDLGNILKGGIQVGLDALLDGLFGRGSSRGGSDSASSSSSFTSGPFSQVLAAGPAAYFDNELIERATERVQSETLKNLNNLRNTLNDLANLTGQSTPEFVNRMEGRLQNYLEPAAQRGYNLLTVKPDEFGEKIAKDTSFQRGNIDEYLEAYSNLNRPTFMDQATNPTTVSMKMGELEDVANTYMDKFRGEMQQGGLMNYMDQQSQEFIQGAGAPGKRYSRENLSDFYSKDRGIQDLMSYSSY